MAVLATCNGVITQTAKCSAIAYSVNMPVALLPARTGLVSTRCHLCNAWLDLTLFDMQIWGCAALQVTVALRVVVKGTVQDGLLTVKHAQNLVSCDSCASWSVVAESKTTLLQACSAQSRACCQDASHLTPILKHCVHTYLQLFCGSSKLPILSE